jgi:DNA-binding response OmpR family regulator
MYRILLVEDDEKISAIITGELAKWGFSVSRVENFESVMEDFAAFEPHLVLLDINLPAYDGFYWCRRLREVSKVPVLFLSSRDTSMDIVMAVSVGGDDYIPKPFSLEVLVAKVNALLRRTYSYKDRDSEIVEYGGAVLNLADNTLHHGGEALELTRNEYRILRLMMQNGGDIVSRERIIRELWECEDFIDDNTLTVNINRLRKRLGDIGLTDYIATVKNQGYRLK